MPVFQDEGAYLPQGGGDRRDRGGEFRRDEHSFLRQEYELCQHIRLRGDAYHGEVGKGDHRHDPEMGAHRHRQREKDVARDLP